MSGARKLNAMSIAALAASPSADEIAKAFDAALEQYDSDMRLYRHEQKRWAEVWADAGVSPAPESHAIEPKRPEMPKELTCECEHCDGVGEITCPECDGSGEDRSKVRAKKARR